MSRSRFAIPLLFCLVSALPIASASGQTGSDEAESPLLRAFAPSSLTIGGTPFHAVLLITSNEPGYSGKVEVWWVSEQQYRVELTSPKFRQTRIVSQGKVSETNDGDFLPRWLADMQAALIDPAKMAQVFRGVPDTQLGHGCMTCDDRPGGITDQLTWGILCFGPDDGPVTSVLTFNHNITFSDWQDFHGKQIAQTYKTDVLAYEPVEGHLSVLEELATPSAQMFTIAQPTPPNRLLTTGFVSTLAEEGMVEHAPHIEWPPVREGKTEGYMIVYARTDRTGQVRETAKHNSDQPGLEDFGMQEALKYKFKPLLIDGVPQQMEMPLVLHFTSRIADALPVLTVEQMRAQMVNCPVKPVPPQTPAANRVLIRLSIDEQGHEAGVQFLSGDSIHAIGTAMSFGDCRFLPLMRDGKPTYYKGDVELLVK